VIPATGANALAVAEYVVCTVMLLLRGAYASSAAVAAGRWPRAALGEGRETAGKSLGVVGFGGIGRLVAKLAQGLGMKVIAADPAIAAGDRVWRESGVAYRGLDDLLAESDAVTLHVPLAPETRHLITGGRLARMKRGAVLVNTARGGIVDEAALAEALASGHLGGAALDVFESEPLPAGSPLAGAPNLVLTPHVAGVTRESNARVSSLIAAKVAQALTQSPDAAA
jgi:(S)-sulfolactate dehydrogenase